MPKHTAYINTILAAALVSVLEHTLARARFLPCTGLAGDARCCIHHQDFARLHELQVQVLGGTGKCYRLQANVKSVNCLLPGNSRFLFPQNFLIALADGCHGAHASVVMVYAGRAGYSGRPALDIEWVSLALEMFR